MDPRAPARGFFISGNPRERSCGFFVGRLACRPICLLAKAFSQAMGIPMRRLENAFKPI
jgi:hypothetical protein